MILLREAAGVPDMDVVRTLFLEYSEWLGIDLCFQGFSDELASLPGKYAPPRGRIILAFEAEQPLGCCAIRAFDDDVCEVKRLWVRPAARGRGLGRELMLRIHEEAAGAEYRAAVLDTLETMTPAIALYESLGYARVDAYYHNPIPGAIYFRKELGP